ncbi:hypothetical protein [Arthrobacter sp. GMC3]|uniref:COG4705 family protein n=1 Tax=Arthrobacter sp. GMC3 TaxID=2058894 RepID=UPI000CE4184F|nr:hypothetical protein [Arthrobacter sp. GMC3]
MLEEITPERPKPATAGPATPLLSKVPQVTAIFWITKVLTTGMGETTSDYLAHALDPAVAVGLGALAFAAALALQFSVKRYIPWVYWLAVVMVSIFGTMAADVLHVGLGIPYLVSTVFYAAVLAIVFLLWHRTEGTLSIHSITSRRRESFYWAAVLATFALGTAAGDLTAMTFNLGYLGSGVLFAVAIAVPAFAYWKFGLKAIPAFWAAYVLTRPLGASFADWMAVSHQRGGLDWGSGPVSVGWALAIVGLVAVLAIKQRRSTAVAARAPRR